MNRHENSLVLLQLADLRTGAAVTRSKTVTLGFSHIEGAVSAEPGISLGE